MTAPIAFPFTFGLTFDVIGTDPATHGVRLARQRFPRVNPYHSCTIRYGPTTYADLDSTILAAWRTSKGGAALTTITVPNLGTISGFFESEVEVTHDSPTMNTAQFQFRREPHL